MKNDKRKGILSTFAILAVIGLIFTACGDDNGDSSHTHTWQCEHTDELFQATFENTAWTHTVAGTNKVYTFGSFNITSEPKIVLTVTDNGSITGCLPSDTFNILEYTKSAYEGRWDIKLFRVSNSSEFSRGFKVVGNTLTFFVDTSYGVSQDFTPFEFTRNN